MAAAGYLWNERFISLHTTAHAGLAIVDRIVRRHGGHVRAEGQGNLGVAFYFTI
jgi:signal transduction histidine kinase